MKRLREAGRWPVIVFAALAAAVCVAACGSSNAASTTKKTTTTSASAKRADFESCLKKAGVKVSGKFGAGSRTFTRPAGAPATGTGTFTRPTGAPATGTGTTGHFTPPAGATGTGRFKRGGFFGSSKDAKALEACAKKYGVTRGTGSFRGGYPGAGGAGAGTAGAAHFTTAELDKFVACVRDNGYAAMPNPYSTSKTVPFPSSVEKNAKFEAAARKCYTDLRPSFPGGGGTTTATTSTTSST